MQYPVRLNGDRRGEAYLRQEAKLYELVDGVLKRCGLPVQRKCASDLVKVTTMASERWNKGRGRVGTVLVFGQNWSCVA